MSESVTRLLTAIGYPEGEASPVGGVSSLLVDGMTIKATEESGRLLLSYSLGAPDEASLRRLAGFAAGRILKEEATLAWDPSLGELMLWQGVPANAAAEVLRRFFEVFSASCDWWRDRLRDEDSGETIPEMMIRP